MNLKNLSIKKRNNLLFEEDITKLDILKGFIARNLNDTRYASKVILNNFQDYFNSKESYTKVKVIRGSFTSQMRNNLKLEKDREISFAHHAVDAMLICFAQMGYEAYRTLQSEVIDLETGEIKDKEKWNQYINDTTYEEKIYQEKWFTIINKMREAEKNIKYWHRVDKKFNRAVSDQTIRGTREVDNKLYKIYKIDIFDKEGYKKFKNLIAEEKGSKFLAYTNDPKTLNLLIDIYNKYDAPKKNAFEEYEKETGDFVRKYSKKHNGPRIQYLKYKKEEVKSCIDISHKYGLEKGSKKVILESLKPYRSDVYYNTLKKSYHIIGLKYADFKYSNGKYELNMESYKQALEREKILNENESYHDLLKKGYHYQFSLYKNDIIYYEKDGKINKDRFLSSIISNRNKVELKPIEKDKYEKRKIITLSKSTCIRKIVTDILGNQYFCDRENFNLSIDNE